jgi:hypothetical protein
LQGGGGGVVGGGDDGDDDDDSLQLNEKLKPYISNFDPWYSEM